MKNVFCLAAALLIAVVIGCSHKTEVKAELEKAAEELAKTEPGQAAPEPAAPAPAATPEVPQPDAPQTQVAPAEQMRAALAEYKTGKLEDAVTRLQKLRAVSTLTPQQRMAVQDSVAAVMNEVYELAAKGNVKAIQAVRQYEEMQTRRR